MIRGLKSNFKLILRLWNFFTIKRRSQFFFLLLFMILSSISEVISIGLAIPFIGALASPEKIFEYHLIKPILEWLSITSPDKIIIPFTLIFVSAVLISGAIRIIMIWAQFYLSNIIGADLSILIYKKTLYQDYLSHVNRNSSEVVAGMTSNLNGVINGVIYPCLVIISGGFVLFSVILTFIIIEPFITLLSFSIFTLIYALIFYISKNRLNRNGERISINQVKVVRAIHEGLKGIRDIIIEATQRKFIEMFSSAEIPLRKSIASMNIIAGLPRIGVETLGLIFIIILSYGFVISSGGLLQAVPILGAFALGAQKLLPVMQQIYQSFANIKGTQRPLNDVLNLLEQPFKENLSNETSKLKFSKKINFNNLTFGYDKNKGNILYKAENSILKGSWVGIIGKTGSGKSTFLDILLGLIEPTEGVLRIDDKIITKNNIRGWHKNIAHVPQNVILTDENIIKNIAFGKNDIEINLDRVYKSAKMARIYDDICSWKNKFETLVGENGVRLSGGQKQRIGIARALYKNADVLILDEATSALDIETENEIIKEIKDLKGSVTVIMVTHRITSLKNCDHIIEIKNKKITSIR